MKISMGGVQYEKDDDLYRVALNVDGKQILFRGKTAAKAKAAATRRKNELEKVDRAAREKLRKQLGEPDGSLTWIRRAIEQTATKVLAGEGREARDDLRALAQAALALHKVHDVEQAEADLRKVEELLAERKRADIHGTRVGANVFELKSTKVN
jgi:hypothetical protein